MTVKFVNNTIYVELDNNLSIDGLTELAHYYLQFLPIVKVDINTTMLCENQIIKYYPISEDEYNRFIEEAKIV